MSREKFNQNINSVFAARPVLRRAVFFIALALLLFFGCTRQIHRVGTRAALPKYPLVRVLLEDNFATGTLLFRGDYRLDSEEAIYILNASVGEFQVQFSDGRLLFRSKQRRLNYRHIEKLDFIPISDSSRFQWNGTTYRGIISFQKIDRKIVVVNTLPLPNYLEGVIPNEIPSHTRDYLPAIEAQAVAARTFAFYQLQHPAAEYFDLFADTRSQVYHGTGKDVPLAISAIRETKGLVLTDSAGNVTETQYHSTCGGILDSGSQYFVGATRAIGVMDDKNDGDFNCAGSPLFRWVRWLDTRTLLKNLVSENFISPPAADSLRKNGFTLGLQVLSRSASGRITKLRVQINDDTIEVAGYRIRRLLSNREDGALPSNLFFLKSSRQDSAKFYIIGAGFGHGRGMCQWGAIGQALDGKTYREILNFYYPALRLKKIY